MLLAGVKPDELKQLLTDAARLEAKVNEALTVLATSS